MITILNLFKNTTQLFLFILTLVSCNLAPSFYNTSFAADTETDLTVLHQSPIKIGIIGDQTGTTDLNAAYEYLQQGVGVLSNKNLDVVIHVGDLLESSFTPQEVTAQYATASSILNALPVNWYMTAGDHDVNPPMFTQDSADRSRETLFKSLYSEHVPEVINHPYYSFDVNGYHFISLYSLEALHADPRWGNIFLNKITDTQFAWLKNDLLNHSQAKGIIVFIHHPMWYNWGDWKRVHRLLSRFRVASVIAGHFHYDQRDMNVDGIRYIVVGATGGSIKQGSRDAGNVQHVSTMTVSGKKVTDFSMISLSDNAPLKLTPRIDMDKIQALDIVLGELWNFSSNNPVFLNGNTLVNSCDSTDPAIINITPIGNPTDKSITIDIGFSTSNGNATLNSAGFVSGQCTHEISDYSCEMARSSRIFVANLSSVSVNPYAGPLWQATFDNNSSTTVGTVLNFDIKLTYPGKSADLYLQRQVSTTVAACP